MGDGRGAAAAGTWNFLVYKILLMYLYNLSTKCKKRIKNTVGMSFSRSFINDSGKHVILIKYRKNCMTQNKYFLQVCILGTTAGSPHHIFGYGIELNLGPS